jgi:predicted amidohydrolase
LAYIDVGHGMTLLTIALFQANPKVRSIAGALADLEVAIENASKSGVEILVTPELFLSGYGCDIAVKANAQMQGSQILEEVARIAKTGGVGIVFGYPETFKNNIYNSAIVFDQNGKLINNYRKVTLPNKFEKDTFKVGDGPEVFEFKGIKCAILICYDLEFPELARRAAHLGAELILVPTALRPKWRLVSDVIVASRAYENAVFIGYCDYASDGPNSKYTGCSTISAPTGEHLMRGTGDEGLIIAQIDTDLAKLRMNDFDFLRDIETFRINQKFLMA